MKGTTKRICAMLLGGVLLLSNMGVMAENVLFPNGDFEGDENGVLYTSDLEGKTYDVEGEYVGGWNGISKSQLMTDETTGNHYIKVDNSYARYRVPSQTITDQNAVWKLSYKYKHDSGAKMAYAFNQNTQLWTWGLPQEYAGAAPGTGEWHTHTTFLHGLLVAPNDYIRFGQSGSNPISGTWYLDDVTMEKMESEIVFANDITQTAKAFFGKVYTNQRETDVEKNLYQRTERVDPIATLKDAITDADTGVRTVKAQVRYVTSMEEEGGTPLTVLAAVYKTVGTQKTLYSVEISDAKTTKVKGAAAPSNWNSFTYDQTVVPMTSFQVPDITVPTAEDGVKYSVKVMVWNNVSGMTPVLESNLISD